MDVPIGSTCMHGPVRVAFDVKITGLIPFNARALVRCAVRYRKIASIDKRVMGSGCTP